MAARSGRLSKPDAQGHFVRQLGWKLNENGERIQHKFRLGADRQEAELREVKLRKVWDAICKAPYGDHLWDVVTLEIASQVARGEMKIKLAPKDSDESPGSYATRLQSIQTILIASSRQSKSRRSNNEFEKSRRFSSKNSVCSTDMLPPQNAFT